MVGALLCLGGEVLDSGGAGGGGGGGRGAEGPANLVRLLQEWDRKAEDARRDYEKAMKEYSVGSRSESSKT